MQCPVCPDQTLLMTERQGVEIDYCPKCRGVWLDRGELDKLIEAAARHDAAQYAARNATPAAAPVAAPAGYQGYQGFQTPAQQPAQPSVPAHHNPPAHAQSYPPGRPPFADSDYPKHGNYRHDRRDDSRSYGKRKSWLSDLFD